MKIGVYGGSFDPPHYGHIYAAGFFLKELELERLYIVPVPSYKQLLFDVSKEDRLALCRLAFGELPRTEILASELDKGFSYTADLLETLCRETGEERLYYLVGSDVLSGISGWYHYHEILERSTLCCAVRGENTEGLSNFLTAAGCDVRFLSGRPPAFSSRRLRAALRQQEDISEMTTPAVAEYIKRKGLYF